MLQDGGLEAHAQISANDKDLVPVFEKLCGLACFQLMVSQDAFDGIYTEEEIDTLSQQVDLLREDQFLEDLYGASSRLTSDQWLKKVCKEGSWVFDSKELRKRLFEGAEIEQRHG